MKATVDEVDDEFDEGDEDDRGDDEVVIAILGGS